MKNLRVAAALSFAHLIGLGKRAEDDEDKKTKRAAEEEEEEQASRAEDEEDKKAGADEEDGAGDEEMQSEEEDEQDGDEKDKGKKARKAKSKAEDGEEEDKDEKDGDKSAGSAVRRERARCAKIIAHGITTGRVRQAGVLAFDTGVSVKAAIAMLDAGSQDKPEADARKSLADRMNANSVPNVGADSDSNAPAGITKVAAAIIAAGEKARGETAKK